MAQISSFKSSIRYQVCNSNVDNDITRKPSIINDDDLCEVKISPTISSPNHHTQLIPNDDQTSKLNEPSPSLILPPKNPLGSSSLSIASITKPPNTQRRQSTHPSFPSHNRRQ